VLDGYHVVLILSIMKDNDGHDDDDHELINQCYVYKMNALESLY